MAKRIEDPIRQDGDGAVEFLVHVDGHTAGPEACPNHRKPLAPAFDLSAVCHKTALTTADLVTATATSRLPVGANLLVVDLAVPLVFDVLTEDLDAIVTSWTIERFAMAAGQIIVYLDKLDAGASLELRYRLKARVSLKAQSGERRVYAYYEPEKKGRAAATLLEVAE